MKSKVEIKGVVSSYHTRWHGTDLTGISFFSDSILYCPCITYSGYYALTEVQLPQVKCSKTDELCPVDISGNIRDCYKIKERNNEKYN